MFFECSHLVTAVLWVRCKMANARKCIQSFPCSNRPLPGFVHLRSCQEWADGIVAVLFRDFGRNMMPACLFRGGCSLSSVESEKNVSFAKTHTQCHRQPLDVIVGTTEPLCQTHLLKGKLALYHFFPLDPVDIDSFVRQPFIFQWHFWPLLLFVCKPFGCPGKNITLNHLALSGAHVRWKEVA